MFPLPRSLSAFSSGVRLRSSQLRSSLVRQFSPQMQSRISFAWAICRSVDCKAITQVSADATGAVAVYNFQHPDATLLREANLRTQTRACLRNTWHSKFKVHGLDGACQ